MILTNILQCDQLGLGGGGGGSILMSFTTLQLVSIDS